MSPLFSNGGSGQCHFIGADMYHEGAKSLYLCAFSHNIIPFKNNYFSKNRE